MLACVDIYLVQDFSKSLLLSLYCWNYGKSKVSNGNACNKNAKIKTY